MNHFASINRAVVILAIQLALITTRLQAQQFSIYSDVWVTSMPNEFAAETSASIRGQGNNPTTAIIHDDSGDVLKKEYLAALQYFTLKFQASTCEEKGKTPVLLACGSHAAVLTPLRQIPENELPAQLLAARISQEGHKIRLQLVNQFKSAMLTVTNDSGNSVFTEVLIGKQYHSKQYDFSYLPAGCYQIAVSAEGKVFHKQVVF
jgi:hypothetical protein